MVIAYQSDPNIVQETLIAQGYDTTWEVVQAWYRGKLVPQFLPHPLVREYCESTMITGPFHVRDSNDEHLAGEVTWGVQVHEYYVDFEAAVQAADELAALSDDESVDYFQVCNAYSNSCYSVPRDGGNNPEEN